MSFDTINEIINHVPSGVVFFSGTVVNNNDPAGLDRIQVAVPGLYDKDRGKLPWCLPIKNSLFGQGNTYGYYGVPAVGSNVVLVLQQNNSDYPVYIGSLHTTKGKEFGPSNLWGYTDPNGNTLKVNTQDNSMVFSHMSGVTVSIKDGTASIYCSNSANITCNTANITAKGGVMVDTPTAEFTNTVKCVNIVASSSMKVAGIEMKTHVHGGVDRGNSSTDGPH